MKRALTALACLALALGAHAQTGHAAANPVARLLSEGRADEAIRTAQDHIQHTPQDAESYNLLGRVYFALGRWDKAVENSEIATRLAPNNSVYVMWLARSYGEKASNSSFMSAIGWAKKARDAFERSVQLDPNNVPARNDLTEFYTEAPGFLGGGADKARAQILEIAKKDPTAAHKLTARIAEKDKDFPAAERELREAIAVTGGDGSAWLDLASFFQRRERLPEMEDAIGKAVNAPKAGPVVLFEAAEMLERTGRNLSRAAELLRQYFALISPAPGTAANAPGEEALPFRAHYLMGSILEKQGNKPSAAKEYTSAVALASEYEPAQKALKRVKK
jgi:tetratricopeptide (TPR) repeat protein